jgi:RHS repeat-associated protein
MTDVSGVTNYVYDSRNRLASKQTSNGTLSYTYDETGSIKTLRSNHANGVSVDYDYDQLNRLSNVKDNRLSGSQNTSYSYDAVGNLQSYTYPNTVTTSYAYNNLNRLTTMTVSNLNVNLASYNYTLGASGNRTAVTENTGRTVNYVYDDLYRLTSETIANSANNGQISYNFDAVGNRLQRNSNVTGVQNQSSTFDANDRLNSDNYDNNGSTKVSNGKSYNYDFENHLTSTSDGISIIYDGDGNRVSKTVNGLTTKYLVNTNNLTGYAQVVEELQNNQVVKSYTYGLDLISQRQSSGVSFYQYDGHGSVRGLSNNLGSVTDTYSYDAFGTLIEQTGTTSNHYLYAGEQFDSDLGFYYNRARYLNVETGRFISFDTYEGNNQDPISLHKYLYANADGVNRIDPSGNISLIDIQITALTIIGSVARAVPAILFYTEFVTLAVGVAALGLESIADIPDDYINPNHGTNNPVEPYEVDEYDDLLRRATYNKQTKELQQHHAPQKAIAFRLIEDYETDTTSLGAAKASKGVAISLPPDEHQFITNAQRGDKNILLQHGKASDLVLRDTLHLKQYTGVSLQNIKNLLGKINSKYPSVFRSIRRR